MDHVPVSHLHFGGFGLDGGEAAVPALEQIIKRGGALGVDEIILGMPHRGRLNVLAAVMGKPYGVIAEHLHVSDKTVANTCTKAKLGVRTLPELMRIAIQHLPAVTVKTSRD